MELFLIFITVKIRMLIEVLVLKLVTEIMAG